MGVKIYKRMLTYTRPYLWKLVLAGIFMIGVSAFQGAIAFLE